MTLRPEEMTVQERFQHLLRVLSSERFLQMEGLGNEVPFFICSYPAEEAVEMQRAVQQLQRRLEQDGLRILNINLYDLSIELLQARGIWERVLQIEETVSREQFLELLQGPLDPEAHLAPAIARKMADREFDIMFITGVGHVFPYIRSHNVLNNLQSTATERPTVMFFPGRYTHSLASGASLNLFDRLQDDKYYRAFDIYNIEV